MRTHPPFANAAIACAEILRNCRSSFSFVQQISQNQTFNGDRFDKLQTTLSPQSTWTIEGRDIVAICSYSKKLGFLTFSVFADTAISESADDRQASIRQEFKLTSDATATFHASCIRYLKLRSRLLRADQT